MDGALLGAAQVGRPLERYAFFMVPISGSSASTSPRRTRSSSATGSIREQYLDLDELGVNKEDKPDYMQDIHRELLSEVKDVRGTARSQILRDFVFDSDEMFMPNKQRAFWFNNYGNREVHPDAGDDVEYFWGPPKQLPMGLIVNTVTLNGRTSITLQSSFNDEAKLTQIVETLTRDIKACRFTEPPQYPKASGQSWIWLGNDPPLVGEPFYNKRLEFALQYNLKFSAQDVENFELDEGLHVGHVVQCVDGGYHAGGAQRVERPSAQRPLRGLPDQVHQRMERRRVRPRHRMRCGPRHSPPRSCVRASLAAGRGGGEVNGRAGEEGNQRAVGSPSGGSRRTIDGESRGAGVPQHARSASQLSP